MARLCAGSTHPALCSLWLWWIIWARSPRTVPVPVRSWGTRAVPRTSFSSWWIRPRSWDPGTVPTRSSGAVPLQSWRAWAVPWAVSTRRSSRTATWRPSPLSNWTVSFWPRSPCWAIPQCSFPWRCRRDVRTRRSRCLPSSRPFCFFCFPCWRFSTLAPWIMGPTRRWWIPFGPRPIWSRPGADGSVRRPGRSWRHAGESLFSYLAVGRFQARLLFRSFPFLRGSAGMPHILKLDQCAKVVYQTFIFVFQPRYFPPYNWKHWTELLGGTRPAPSPSTLMPGWITLEDVLLSQTQTEAFPQGLGSWLLFICTAAILYTRHLIKLLKTSSLCFTCMNQKSDRNVGEHGDALGSKFQTIFNSKLILYHISFKVILISITLKCVCKLFVFCSRKSERSVSPLAPADDALRSSPSCWNSAATFNHARRGAGSRWGQVQEQSFSSASRCLGSVLWWTEARVGYGGPEGLRPCVSWTGLLWGPKWNEQDLTVSGRFAFLSPFSCPAGSRLTSSKAQTSSFTSILDSTNRRSSGTPAWVDAGDRRSGREGSPLLRDADLRWSIAAVQRRPLFRTPALIFDVWPPAAAEDLGRGRHVQGGGGWHTPAGVRAQSGRDGGRDPGAGDRRRGALQRSAQHDLKPESCGTCRGETPPPPVPVYPPLVPLMEFLRHEKKKRKKTGACRLRRHLSASRWI